MGVESSASHGSDMNVSASSIVAEMVTSRQRMVQIGDVWQVKMAG